jgi:hypothetical protein
MNLPLALAFSWFRASTNISGSLGNGRKSVNSRQVLINRHKSTFTGSGKLVASGRTISISPG